MENSFFINVTSAIEKRLRDCQVLTLEDFDFILNNNLDFVDKDRLSDFVSVLFEEHTRVTSLINDVCDLVSSVKKFPIIQ